MINPHDYTSTNDIIRAHKGHYFEPGTMRFFKSRVLPDVFIGAEEVYFVTSERYENRFSGTSGTRKFTVRAWNPATDGIRTVSPFNELTRAVALRTARDCAKGVQP